MRDHYAPGNRRCIGEIAPDSARPLHSFHLPGLNLANSTAHALRDLGDLAEAEHQFKRSRATRDGVGHPRTYSLTLANLADVQFTRGLLPQACQNWSKSLDAMAGIRSARADQAVRNLRSRLATLGPRKPTFAQQLNQHAAAWQ